MNKIEVIKADITTLEVDAIVNAANSRLAGGGGVDGAIHNAAGAELNMACNDIGGCYTGDAVITSGFNLRAKNIIHTVGPVWKGGNYNEPELLASCYQNSLLLAVENNIKSIAFPNISTGVYGFPKADAAKIAITETQKFICVNSYPSRIIFVCFDDENYRIYSDLLL